MSSWKEYKLIDLVSFSQGIQVPVEEQYKEKLDNMERFIRIVDYTNPNEEPRYIIKKSNKYWVNENDVVMIRYGWAGKVVNGIKGYIANNMFRIIVEKSDILDKEYLYYFLSQRKIYEYLVSCNSSTTMPSIKFSDFNKINIKLPTLEEQRYIVSFLKDFDKKIQLNTQINQTLEQIAQTIFKSWFIDFDPVHAKANALASGQTLEQATQAAMAVISGKNTQELHRLQTANPEQYQQLWEIAEAFPSGVDEEGVPRGWEERYLKDVCNIVYGKGLPKNKLTEKGFYVFGANGVIGFYDSYTYEKPQVLIGCRGTVGQVTLSYPYSFVTNNSLVIEYENSCVSMYYLEKYLSNINLKEISSGSVQPQITIQNMSKVKILIPNIEILNFYSEKVKEIYDKRLNHFYENQSLSKVRDLLLPKLLSGEV
ncbi:restriction endonuclease subunit S [Glaesserella parasuis]|uniref:restriction endonuclease subunit S n=1 Tax=Glaesserella parasuis TaxID=738 RepID=UPI0004B0F5B7|nr:restriction endonuclease subunit S [Glaesserella parasuis]MDP0327783.1 restriction endonuclease subunit S [Glaesserella parasuis]MDP0391271.1 restriction endonuclease subunit S [Glaesserella parasuis]